MYNKSYNILYVDDEISNLSSFKNLFRRKFNIITASSGQQGLEILEAQPIHVVIADQRMPNMKGVEFLKKVQDSWPDLKYILLTAFDDNEVVKEAINEVGIFWYVNKPFAPDQMEQILINAIVAYQAENKLKESEEKFRSVFNSITDVFTRSDMDGNCIIVSPSIYNLLGYKPEEIIGRRLSDFYVDPKKRAEIVNELQKTKNVQNFEVDIIRKDGKIITVSANVKMYYDSKGDPLGVEGNIRDITRQKKINEQLRESGRHFRATFEQAAVGIAHVAPSGLFRKTNMKFLEIVGYSEDEMQARILQDIIHPNDQKKDLDQLNLLLEGKSQTSSSEKRYFKKDGEIVCVKVTISLIRDEKGNPDYFVFVLEDITEQKKAESEHDKLFNVAFDLLCIAGFDGYFKQLNPAWEKVTGYTIEELKEKPFKNFIHEEDWQKTSNEIKELESGKATINFENRYIKKNGDIIYFSWTVTPMPEERLFYCIARDVTEQKKTEWEILEYQLRLKNLAQELTVTEEKVRKQIAADLHDHVGQMLSSVRMQMTRIIDKEENPELLIRQKNISQTLLKAIQATRSAIFDLSPPQLNELGLSAAIHDWMKGQIETKYKIATSIFSEIKEVSLPENTRYLLFRSIKELCNNVVKHAKANYLSLNIEIVDNELQITVQDDGIGFKYNPALLRLKSDSFGLFSVQERISNLDGTMEVESEGTSGTKIILKIPIEG